MKMIILRKCAFFAILSSVLFSSCKQTSESIVLITNEADFTLVQGYYQAHMKKAIDLLDSLSKYDVNSPKAKEIFKQIRINFKIAEPYASYLNPEVGHRANGPALPYFKEDTGKVMRPFGLQKIEESIYEGEETQAQFLVEIGLTKGLFNNLLRNIATREITPQRFFIATHQQLLRIVSHSISGFDTPVSHLGLEESKFSLLSLHHVYSNSILPIILEKNPSLDHLFSEEIERAVGFIEENPDFDNFDRYTFIRDYVNPITRSWVAIRKSSGLWNGVQNKPFNFDAPTFFENNSFNTVFFTPVTNRNVTQAQIELGERLFYEPKLSASGTMACVSCHMPEKGYADGLVVNIDNAGMTLERNTPTLLNSIFQQAYFWDGRSPKLEDQVSTVFENEKEFNSSVHQFSTAILSDPEYIKLLEKAFGSIPKKNTEIVRAISSYVGTLNSFNSKFDRNMRDEERTFTAEEQLGMNLFMGKALCATCHFMPLTNGTVPPFFTETEKEVIGVPKTAANDEIDDDTGFFFMYNEPLHWGMFKTPTVRNAELTAPYMHNGVYGTLEEVMDFYNQGGGVGMGFDLEHQTLPFENLNLTPEELKALVSFVKTLTDNPEPAS